MDAWHRSRSADIGLRAIGLLLGAVAYLAISRLVALDSARPEEAASAQSLALAAVGFLCSSAGGAMSLLGNHLFDQVKISARWAPRS